MDRYARIEAQRQQRETRERSAKQFAAKARVEAVLKRLAPPPTAQRRPRPPARPSKPAPFAVVRVHDSDALDRRAVKACWTWEEASLAAGRMRDTMPEYEVEQGYNYLAQRVRE